MRIAVSGTHFMGKSTLIADFIRQHPAYQYETEPHYKLQDEYGMALSLEPTFDILLEQLDYSIQTLHDSQETNIIFDRCPVDFIAYAMYSLERDRVDIHDNEISERFPDVKEALNSLDLIVFLPITKQHLIEYTEDDPAYRKGADKCFKKLYRDDICDIFPRYNHPRIIEIFGDRLTRIKKLESYL